MTGDTPLWADEIEAFVSAEGPVPFAKLAGRVNVSSSALRTFLDEHPYLWPHGDGRWVSGLRVADGLVLRRELDTAELEAGGLSADVDVALWARFAQVGRRLAGGGEASGETCAAIPAVCGNERPS